MKIKEIIDALERFAPLPLQDGFDNAGLQVGLPEAETTGALLCLDVTEAVVDEAVALGFGLIVSHHPLLFKGCKSVTGRNGVERCLLKAIRNDVAVYSAHTNLDNASGGVNFRMAREIGLQHVEILAPKEDSLLKLVTFVPRTQADEVRNALFGAGCGCIGKYDSCSYNTEGEGTFRAGEDTHPFCGKPGERHTEPEVRIETVLPAFRQAAALKALRAAHPYEEPAFDVYPLKNAWHGAGSGLIGALETPEAETDFLLRLKQAFGTGCVKHSRLSGRPVRTVALCGGAGAFLLPRALGRADVFVTGEFRYHEYLEYGNDLLIAEIGHYESEQYTQDLIYSILREACPGLALKQTRINTNPINYL